MYINPGMITNSYSTNQAYVIYELLYEMYDLTDKMIMNTLGTDGPKARSDWIEKNCVKGAGNN